MTCVLATGSLAADRAAWIARDRSSRRVHHGFWSDGCYGGHITGPFIVTDGAFDWPARFNVGAGAPEPRDVRAVGTVSGDRLTLSMVELTGDTFGGPRTLFPADEVNLEFCD